MLYVATALYFTWVGAWLVEPAPRPIVVDDMTGISVWSAFEYGRFSPSMHKVTDRTTHALALDYTAVANKSGDTPGKGAVLIGPIKGFP